jgi:hypothetical protein
MNQSQKNTARKTNVSKTAQKPEWAPGMPFKPANYILMIAGVVILLIGYFLLSGGGSDNPAEFSDAIFNARRLKMAPILLVIGFIIELFAIMYRPRSKEEESEPKTEANA